MPERIDEFQQPIRNGTELLRQVGPSLSEATVPLDPLADAHLGADGYMHLSGLTAVGSTQVLGFMQLTLGAPTRGLAACAGTDAQEAADQRSALLEDRVQIATEFLVQVEDLAT